MSPYLFIIAMEFLTKEMNRAAKMGRIVGVRLVPSALRLTHALYVDDLIIFGQATEDKAEAISEALETFGHYLSLKVNPNKSTIWFSMDYDGQCKQKVLDIIHAKVAGCKEKYLGIYMKNKNQGNDGTRIA
jgi:Reverse transcriptase (RNA-dependent DNA polymerase)